MNAYSVTDIVTQFLRQCNL